MFFLLFFLLCTDFSFEHLPNLFDHPQTFLHAQIFLVVEAEVD